MKIKENYVVLKKEHQDAVFLIKVGSFYLAYESDAQLLHYLFSYQIKDNKLGFPLSALEKILEHLKQKKISYFITDELSYQEEENQYYVFLEQAKKSYYDKLYLDLLLERIQFLIHKDSMNYVKIKGFVDELS